VTAARTIGQPDETSEAADAGGEPGKPGGTEDDLARQLK